MLTLPRTVGSTSGGARNSTRELSAAQITPLLPAFTPEAATAATGAIPFWACLVNVQGTTIKVDAVDGGNRFVTLSVICHLNEAETTRLAALTIRADVDTINRAVGCKQGTDRIFRSPKTEV